MAPGRKTGGKNFKKGAPSPNPKGGQLHNPVVKKLKAITNDQIAEIGTILLEGTIDELREIIRDEQSTVMRKWLASVSLKGVVKSDYRAMNAILDRIAGKVKERVEWSSDPENPMIVKVAAMTPEERERFILQAAKDLNDCDE